LEDLGVERKIISMDVREVGQAGQVQQTQVREKWLALVSTVMNLWIP